MTIGRIACRRVDTADPHESARAAAQRMAARSVGTLVVQDADARPLGILTDRDLAVRLVASGRDPNTTPVSEVMSDRVHTVPSTTPIEEALSTMRAKAIRRLVVVRADGRVCGVVSLDDVLSLLAEEFRDVGRLLEKESPQRVVLTH